MCESIIICAMEGKFEPLDFKQRLEARPDKRERKQINDDLARFYEALSVTVADLYEVIYDNPDTSADELMVRAEMVMKEHGVICTEQQKQELQEVFHSYEQKHQIIQSYEHQAQDPSRFFADCFGFTPYGKVEVVTGPMTFFFKCYDPVDFLAAFFHKNRDTVTPEDTKAKENTRGGACHEINIPDLNNLVCIGNMKAIGNNKAELMDVMDHEEQHQYNELFVSNELDYQKSVVLDSLFKQAGAYYKDGKVPAEIRTSILEEYLVLVRKVMGIDTLVRDEIIAQYTGGASVSYIEKVLRDGPSYNFSLQEDAFSRIEETKGDISSTILNHYGKKFGFSFDPYSDQELDRAIATAFDQRYKKDISHWLEAIAILEEKNYTPDKIVGMLSFAPVS